jgi:hypothetical protein
MILEEIVFSGFSGFLKIGKKIPPSRGRGVMAD